MVSSPFSFLNTFMCITVFAYVSTVYLSDPCEGLKRYLGMESHVSSGNQALVLLQEQGLLATEPPLEP